MENHHQTENWLKRSKPFIGVVFLQFGFAGMDILIKASMNKGMSNYVLVVYRHAVAFFVITPFALFLDKLSTSLPLCVWVLFIYFVKNKIEVNSCCILFYRNIRPKMTFSIFIKIMALAVLEPVLEQNMFVLGIKYTTASFGAAMENMIPAITFLLASILRLEKIKIKSIHSQAKVVGTLATVSGAMVMTFFKGPVLLRTHGGNDHNQYNDVTNIQVQHPIKGAVMLIIGCFSFASFVILQAITLETYPAELSLTSWICILGTVDGAVVAMIMERGNPSAWAMKWDIKLLTVFYSGIVCSGLTYYLQGVVMKTRGPVFVTAFSPLSMVIVAIMSSLFLAEQLNLGRVIGAIIIVLGLYLVVWGKSKDYDPPTPIVEEPILLPEQILEKGNSKNEHSTHEVHYP